MDERQRKQIELIVAHEVELAHRASEQESRAIFAAHSAKGVLGSGATVQFVSSAIGKVSENLLKTLISKVGNISRTPAAFEIVDSGIVAHFSNMEAKVFRAAQMASRRGHGDPIPSVLNAAQTLFGQAKADIRAKIEIERFEFELPLDAPNRHVQHTSPAIDTLFPNKGGKPLAEHWDAMWAEIAFQLFSGALQPKRQSDITKAMNDWLAEKGFDAGDTAVTQRARAMWQRMERG